MPTNYLGPSGGIHSATTFAARTVATVNGVPSIIPAGSSLVTDPHGKQSIVDAPTLAADYIATDPLPVQTGAGAPGGAPAGGAGSLYFDTSGLKLYCYTGAAWKSVLLS